MTVCEECRTQFIIDAMNEQIAILDNNTKNNIYNPFTIPRVIAIWQMLRDDFLKMSESSESHTVDNG